MKALISTVLIALIAIAAVCYSSPCGSPIHDWPSGSIRTVFTDGSSFFYGAGSAVVMTDVDGQGELSLHGHIRPQESPAIDAAVVGNFALLGANREVSVLDLEGPGLPIEIGEIAVPGEVKNIRAAEEIAVAHWQIQSSVHSQGLEVIDLGDPAQPVIVSRIELPSTQLTMQMTPGWLYLLIDGRLLLYDLSDPVTPILVAEMEQPTWTTLLTVHEDTLVVGAGSDLVLVDIAVQASPQVQAIYQPVDSVDHALWVEDSLMLAAGGSFEVVDVSVSPPARIALVEEVFAEGVLDMTAAPGQCLVIEGGYWFQNLRAIDISSPTAPNAGPRIIRPSAVLDLAVSPGRIGALTAYGLWLLNLEPDGSYTERHAAQTEGISDHVDFQHDLALIGRMGRNRAPFDYRLQVFDLATGDEAEVIAEIDLESHSGSDPWSSHQVAGNGWVAIALEQDSLNRIEIIDVREPSQPVRGVSIPLSRKAMALAMEGDLLFVLDGFNDLVVIDVSNPLRARRVGELGIDESNWQLAAWGRYIFTLGTNDLLTVDAARPDQPVLIGGTGINEGYATSTKTTPGLLFVHHGDSLEILDVSSPSEPTGLQTLENLLCSVGGYDIRRVGIETSIGDGLVIQGGVDCGLQAMDVSACGNPDAIPATNFVVTPPFPVTGESVQFFDHSAGGPDTWAWNFGDGSSSDLQEPQHVYIESGTFTVTLTTSNSSGSASISTSLEIGEPSAQLEADFSWTNEEPSVLRPVRFVDISSGRPSSWSWAFGDGFASTEANPSHLYSIPGDYEVTLQVGDSAGTSTISKTISVAPVTYQYLEQGGDNQKIITAAAATPGRHGTQWQTDFTLHNPLETEGSVRVFFLDRAEPDNTLSPGTLVNLHPRQTITLENVVGDLFGLTETAGAVWIGNAWYQLVTSRTFTPSQNGGSYGQSVPSLDRGFGPCEPTEYVLLGLRHDNTFRSNVGFVNLAGWPLEFTAFTFTSDGILAEEWTIELGPFGIQQVDGVMDGLEHGYILIDICDPWIKAYASVIDNRTGDATFWSAKTNHVEPSLGEDTWVIPAVASVDGANGTQWESQLELLNLIDQESVVELTLLETGSTGEPSHQHVLSLAVGEVVRIDDVVNSLFGLKATGALVIKSSAGLHATSRTFTGKTEEGTYGQHIPAIPAIELLNPDDQASLLHLKENDGFRSNVGFVNPSPNPAVVVIEAWDMQGVLQTTATVELAAWEHRQDNRLLVNLGGNDEATLTLRVITGTVAAYASVVDNVTGDPVFLPALQHR